VGEGCERRGDGGIEALEVPDSYDAALSVGESQDVVGLGEGGGEGLLDEDIEAGKKKLFGDGGVMAGGDADGDGVERRAGIQQLGDGGEGWDVVG